MTSHDRCQASARHNWIVCWPDACPDRRLWGSQMTEPMTSHNAGDYPQKLTFLKTTGNHRVYKKFSLLITQLIMSEDYFNFWNEMQNLSEKGGLFDAPPYNLHTNFKALNTSKKVYGYFGVVEEKAARLYFDKNDLSYKVEDDVVELCNISYGPDGPGGPECYDCLEYPYGDPSNTKPSWWIE